MKKSIFLALFAMLSVSLSAQHVTPLNIHITDFNFDSLRAQYQGQSYLLELERLEKLMKDDAKKLKDVQGQLKAEKDFQKQMMAYVDKAEASFKNLQTLSQKELDELAKIKENADKQLRAINNTSLLNEETREKALDQLQNQRRGLDGAINATTNRQTQLANHPMQLQQMRTDLMVYSNEIINKEADIKQLETSLKNKREAIKAEVKNVKSQK
ncbi:MAG: hypothetical protein IKO63_07030 [Paludibacteraceae bacterium]|nr:hypothetical protein [Paludibacteraceae bacterium]